MEHDNYAVYLIILVAIVGLVAMVSILNSPSVEDLAGQAFTAIEEAPDPTPPMYLPGTEPVGCEESMCRIGIGEAMIMNDGGTLTLLDTYIGENLEVAKFEYRSQESVTRPDGTIGQVANIFYLSEGDEETKQGYGGPDSTINIMDVTVSDNADEQSTYIRIDRGTGFDIVEEAAEATEPTTTICQENICKLGIGDSIRVNDGGKLTLEGISNNIDAEFMYYGQTVTHTFFISVGEVDLLPQTPHTIVYLAGTATSSVDGSEYAMIMIAKE